MFKHINVETARYLKGERASSYTSLEEFYTGVDANGEATKSSLKANIAGANFKDIERTTFETANEMARRYGSDPELNNAIFNAALPSLISAMPALSSGSDQIINMMGFITGQKKKDGKWQIDSKSPISEADTAKRTEKYLTSLTAENIIDMKSDSIDAVINRLANNHLNVSSEPERLELAAQDYRDIISRNEDILSELKKSPNLARMKAKNHELLRDLLH